MAVGESDDKKQKEKGFVGLSSLVPKVDTTAPPAPTTEPVGSPVSVSHSAPQSTQPPQPPPPPQHQLPPERQAPPIQPQTHQAPVQPASGGSSVGKWVLGIAAVIGLFWFVGQLDTHTPPSASANTPSTQSAAPTYSPPDQPQLPSGPQESSPPIGQDLVLSIAQIRYCLAEEIRMQGAESVLDENNRHDVDRFNVSVADYNSRCSQFRYRQGSLEAAQREVGQYRAHLLLEGRNRFVSSSNVQPRQWAAADPTPAAISSGADATAARRVEPPSPPRRTHIRQPPAARISAPEVYDSENKRALESLAQAHAAEANKRDEAQRIGSTPGAHKRWDYKTGRDIWVDAYGNPVD